MNLVDSARGALADGLHHGGDVGHAHALPMFGILGDAWRDVTRRPSMTAFRIRTGQVTNDAAHAESWLLSHLVAATEPAGNASTARALVTAISDLTTLVAPHQNSEVTSRDPSRTVGWPGIPSL